MYMLTFAVVWHLKAAERFLQEIIDLFLLQKEKNTFVRVKFLAWSRTTVRVFSWEAGAESFFFFLLLPKDDWENKTKKFCGIGGAEMSAAS